MNCFIIILTTFVSFCYSQSSEEIRPPSKDQQIRLKHGKLVEITSSTTTVVTSTSITTLKFDENSTKADAELRVIGGEDTTPKEFPFIVSLQTYPNNHFCAGTIINASWVLTAAHCLTGVELRPIRVIAGKHSLSTEERTEQVRNVQAVFVHPKYHLHDAALIKLDHPFSMDIISLTVQSKLPASEDFEPDYNSFGSIIGWGQTEKEGQISDVLQEVQVPIVPPEICSQQYQNLSSISTSHICAGGNGAGMCNFDDGGPLLCCPQVSKVTGDYSGTIFCGIASWSAGCGNKDFSGIFTRVSSLHSWIYTTIRASENPKGQIDEKVLQTEPTTNPGTLTTTLPPPTST